MCNRGRVCPPLESSQEDVWLRAVFLMKIAPGANFRTVIQRHPRVRKSRETCTRTDNICISKVIPAIFFSFFLFLVIAFTLQLNSYEVLPSATFWTSRGHRFLPFSPPVLACIFSAHRVRHSHFSIGCGRRVASNFTNSRFRAFRLSICEKYSVVGLEPTTSTSIVTRLTIGSSGTQSVTACHLCNTTY